ncbi:hypothetical protein AMR41_26350 [Hapalosiphon sp. MRB220]|nr:hypothetical protein AMR41_26350 [Hapalosiphon sp. MRB220]
MNEEIAQAVLTYYDVPNAQLTFLGQKFMSTLQQTDDTWGLIHADLHQGNYVLYGEQVRPIEIMWSEHSCARKKQRLKFF